MRNYFVRWAMGSLVVALAVQTGCKAVHGKRAMALGEVPAPMESSYAMGAPVNSSAEGSQVAETAGVEQTTNAAERLMTYDATLHVVVQDVAGVLKNLAKMATGLKGYMQAMTGNSIILRIPAAQLNAAIQQVEGLGPVTAREIKGNDVTEEMLDLDIRLKNLQETREHLLRLLDKGNVVEDLLKVEKELERVTGDIESLKGRIKFLSHAIAYSTLTVVLNSPVPQTEPQAAVPFAWVRDLAAEIASPSESSFSAEARFRKWLQMDLPPGYVKVHEVEGLTRAMSGNGVTLLVRREGNFEGGTMEFWGPTIRRWLTGSQVIAIGESKELALDTGLKGILLEGDKTLGRTTFRYLLLTVASRKFVYTVECWGPAEEVAKQREAVVKACQSMKTK